jgi:hypothetical protein
MTPEQIDKLPIDDLRIAIAERRGWTQKRDCPGGVLRWIPPADAITINPPDYPRSWSTAGELLMKIKNWRIDSVGETYSLTIHLTNGDFLMSYGDTAPEAISRCWLKATEERI